MTYSQVGQRGGQPLYIAIQTSRQKVAQRPAQDARSEGPHGVKFGSGFGKKAIDGSVSVFQKINEVFIWGFLAQDVVGMWLPRVGTSLKVGREPYDPSEDPEAKNLPFDQQVKKWIIGNVKGLNWVNFSEGTKRESATGPGLLAMPALLFMMNRYMGNPSQELSFASMTRLRKGFREHLKAQEAQGRTIDTKEAYKAEVHKYIRSMFVDPDVKNVKIGRQSLDDWCKAWTETAFAETDKNAWERVKDNFGKKSGPAYKLGEMAEALHKHILAFNREHRAVQYDAPKGASPLAEFIKDDAPLHRADHVWASYQPHLSGEEAKKQLDNVHVSKITEDLKRFGWAARSIWDNHQTKKEGYTLLSEAVDKTMKDLVVRKFWLGVGTTVLSALYLTRLAFWAQNHGTYQAVRQFRDDAPGNKKKHQGASQPSAQAAMPMQPSLPSVMLPGNSQPFGTPPVFMANRPSMFAMPTPYAPAMPVNTSATFGSQPMNPADWRRA